MWILQHERNIKKSWFSKKIPRIYSWHCWIFSLEVCTKNHVIQPEETMGFSKKKMRIQLAIKMDFANNNDISTNKVLFWLRNVGPVKGYPETWSSAWPLHLYTGQCQCWPPWKIPYLEQPWFSSTPQNTCPWALQSPWRVVSHHNDTLETTFNNDIKL